MKSFKWALVALVFISLSALIPVHAGPFTVYSPGVSTGVTAVYDCYGCLQRGHSTINLVVTSVVGTVINFTLTYVDDSGAIFSTLSNSIDVNGIGQSVFPTWFIGANLANAPIQPGSAMVAKTSFLGHIIDGQWRITNYWDISMLGPYSSAPGLTSHTEWDKATGLMTSSQNSYNNAGSLIQLRHTSLWSPNLIWIMIATVVDTFSYFVGWIELAFGLWIGTFFMIGVTDWYHVRKLRGNRGQKPSMFSGQMIKYFIVIAVIMVLVMIAVLFLLQLGLSAAMGPH